MERVIQIIMQRDKMSYADAKDLVETTREELIAVAAEYPDEADDILMDNLGLEPDYMMDLLMD